MSLFKRSIAQLLLIALMFSSLSMTPLLSQRVSAQTAPEAERTELTEARTSNIKFFQEVDGSQSAEVYSEPVHVQDENGAWQDIDTSLVPSTDPRFAFETANASLEASFADSARTEDAVQIDTGSRSFAFGPVNASAETDPEPIVSENTITYPEIYANTDLSFTVESNAVKETVVLSEAPSTPPAYKFPISTEGLVATEGEAGIELLNGQGAVVLAIPQPFMVDSSVHPASGDPAYSEAVSMSIEEEDGQQMIVIEPSNEWLTDPERIFPVLIDPTTERVTHMDTFVQTGISSPQHQASELKAGTFNGGTTKARSLFKFNISGLSGNIQGAEFSINETYAGSCTAKPVVVRRVTQSWDYTANWTNQPSVASNDLATVNAAKGYSGSCPAGRISFASTGSASLTQVVSKWIDGSYDNYGLEIRASNETDNLGWKKFSSSEAAAVPKLIVAFNNPPSTPSNRTPSNGTVTTDTTPTLSASYNDAQSGDWGHLEFEVYQASATVSPGNIIRSGNSSGGNPGPNQSWTPSALALGSYKWRVRATDGVDYSAWTGTTTFDVSAPVNTPPQVPDLLEPSDGTPVDDSSPLLGARYSDPDGDSGKLEYEVYGSEDSISPTNVKASGYATGTSGSILPWRVDSFAVPGDGTTTTWTYGSQTDLPEGAYKWRVRANDGPSTSAWSSVRSFIVDLEEDSGGEEEMPLLPGGGSSLAVALPANASGTVLMDSVEFFDAAGGVAIIDPDSATPETITYDGIDTVTTSLLGVARENPIAHAEGMFVEHQLASLSAQPITETTPDGSGGTLDLESVAAFHPGGGAAVIGAGTSNEETITYTGIDVTTNQLLGVDRVSPQSHSMSVLIASEPDAEMVALLQELDAIDSDETDVTEHDVDPSAGSVTSPGNIFDRDFSESGATDTYSGTTTRPCSRPDTDGDGVADYFNFDCSPVGWWDFGGSDPFGFSLNTDDDWQKISIHKSARVRAKRGNGGDAGIAADRKTDSGQRFQLKAWVRLTHVTRSRKKAFRGRVTIHFKDADQDLVWECNAPNPLFETDSEFHLVQISSCEAPPGAEFVRANVRARSTIRSSDDRRVAGWGNVIVDRVVWDFLGD